MRLVTSLRKFGIVFAMATVVYALKTRQSHGEFLRVPFEFRIPTPRRVRDRWWNKNDSRLFTPHVFGVGWSVNLYRLLSLLGYAEKSVGEGADETSSDEQR